MSNKQKANHQSPAPGKFFYVYPNPIFTLMTRYITIYRSLLALLLLLGLWSACKKSEFRDIELGDHAAEFAFPLFTTDLILQDLLAQVLNDSLSNDTLVVNSDGTMTLFYTGDVAEKKATDIFTFFQDGFVPLLDSNTVMVLQVPMGVIFKEAQLKAGILGFVLTNQYPEALTGRFEVPQLTKNGQALVVPFSIPPTTGLAWNSGPIDLNGYTLSANSNELRFIYYAYLPDGTRVKIPPNSSSGFSNVLATFFNLEFGYFEGNFGYAAYPLTRDTIEIDINQTNLDGNVKVKNPKITMRISNSWGFPTRGIIRYLSFIGQNGEEYKLESTVFLNDSIIDFAYPTLNEVGQTKYTDVYLDETNSNIAQIFNSQPTRLVYDLGGVSNALQTPDAIGFLTDSSNISLQIKVELDLEGSVKNFESDQTLDLDFGEYSDFDTTRIQEVEFKLVTENATPISALLQLYFLDADSSRIDSLFSNGPQLLLRSAPVGADGKATGSTRTENFIPMSASRFDRIRQSKQAFLHTSFTTAEDGQVPVKLIATNRAIIKMGLKVKTK